MAERAATNIRATSELMKNQKQAVVMGDQQDFQVLQTAEGDAIFFSIGSDGVLYVTHEVRTSGSGWNRTDLSSSVGKGKAKWFAVSQNPATLAIDLGLVMSVHGHDSLYLSRNNVISSDRWAKSVSWTSVAFDAKGAALSPLVVADLYMLTNKGSDGSPGPLTWFVDIVKNPEDNFRRVERYYIEPDSSPKWVKHSLPDDVEEGSISSCLGRRDSDLVDGIYTFGKIGDSKSLIFTPTKDVWSPHNRPRSARLNFPNGSSGISSCVNEQGLTGLFVAADGGLYLFPPDRQSNDAEPLQVLPSSPVCNTNTFAGATHVRSSTVGSQTAVWGLNGRGDLVYSRCRTGQEAEPSSWSPPMRICAGVTQFAFYLNRMAPSNVLFARLQDQSLLQLAQDPETGVWNRQRITLPTTDPRDMVEDTTYTTQVKCTDPNGMPAMGSSVRLESMQRASLIINNAYYKIGPDSPIDIMPDATGSITIVQVTDALPAIFFKLTCGDQTLEVDPQSKMVEKLSAIKSASDLSTVRIPDSNGRSKPLVPDDVSEDDREAVAQMVPKILDLRSSLKAYGSLDTTARNTTDTGDVQLWGVTRDSGGLRFLEGKDALACLGGRLSPSPGDVSDWIHAVAGDLFPFLKDAWKSIKKCFIQVVNGITHFIVEIAGAIYAVLLDSFPALAHALEFLFMHIKVLFEGLFLWLGFLFHWDDILVTHCVIKNCFKQYAQHAADQIGVLRSKLQDGFDELHGFINGKTWKKADLSPDPIGKVQGNANVPGADSPQANWALHHTINGLPAVASSTTVTALPGVDPSSVYGLLESLQQAVTNEESVLQVAVERIQDEVFKSIHTMSVFDVIDKVMSILGEFVVDTAKNILLTLVDLVQSLVSGFLALLDTPIEIPIISPIYETITGGDTLSCMDLVSLIAAIPGTLVYDLVTGEVPFPDDASTKSLINASSFSELCSILSNHPPPTGQGPSNPPSLAQKVVAVLKICNALVAVANFGFAYYKRETGVSSPGLTALSFSLYIASGTPTLTANFVDITTWTVAADALFCLGYGKLCLENWDGLNETFKDFFLPWISSLLGAVRLGTTIWGRCVKENAKPSDEIAFVGGIFSGIGGTLAVFTSTKLFPEIAPVTFGISAACAVVGGQLSAGSGVCVLNET